jgi:hypothetical protein
MPETTDAETRTRYQMLLLSLWDQTSSQIAQTVLRSQDTVVCVLKRFLIGGVDAVPWRTAPICSSERCSEATSGRMKHPEPQQIKPGSSVSLLLMSLRCVTCPSV